MDPLSSNTVTIRHTSLEHGDYHAILRSGQYACMFDNFYRSARSLCVVDLENNKTLRSFKCELNESILAFNYPYLVTRIEQKIKIWDVSSSFKEPKVIHTDLIDIKRGAILGKTIVIASTQFETSQPKYITIIRDFDKPQETIKVVVDDAIDGESGLTIYKDYVVYSTYFGSLKLLPLDDPEGDPKMLDTVGDVNAYLEKLTKENAEEFTCNTVQSMIVEEETLAFTTASSLKIWNVAKDCLQNEIKTKKNHWLLSLDGRFVLGVTHKKAKIWDSVTGNVIYKEKAKEAFPSAGNIPSLTIYKNKIYHVGRSKEREDIIIKTLQETQSTPQKQEKKANDPSDEKQQFQKDQNPKKENCLVS